MHTLPPHFARLARVALWVAAIDLGTKALAVLFLAARSADVAPALRLSLVYNDRAAFGISIGAYTWHVSLALTVLAILLSIPVSRDLSRVDAAAPTALGLVVGGALGNMLSMLTSAAGVPDFIAVHDGAGTELVFNLADVAAYVGIVMLARTAVALVRAIGDQRRRARQSVVAARPRVVREVEVPRAVYLDGVSEWPDLGGPVVRICADGRVERPARADTEVPVPGARRPRPRPLADRAPRARTAADFPRPASVEPPPPGRT